MGCDGDASVFGILNLYPPTQARLFRVLLGHRAAIVIMCLLVLVLNFQSLAVLQASSRYLWALSRDKSIPFSSFFYRVSKDKLPVAATWLLVLLATPMVAVLWTYPQIVPAVLYSASGMFWAFVFVSPVAVCIRGRVESLLTCVSSRLVDTSIAQAPRTSRFGSRGSLELEST